MLHAQDLAIQQLSATRLPRRRRIRARGNVGVQGTQESVKHYPAEQVAVGTDNMQVTRPKVIPPAQMDRKVVLFEGNAPHRGNGKGDSGRYRKKTPDGILAMPTKNCFQASARLHLFRGTG
jgi:hypothetical protein